MLKDRMWAWISLCRLRSCGHNIFSNGEDCSAMFLRAVAIAIFASLATAHAEPAASSRSHFCVVPVLQAMDVLPDYPVSLAAGWHTDLAPRFLAGYLQARPLPLIYVTLDGRPALVPFKGDLATTSFSQTIQDASGRTIGVNRAGVYLREPGSASWRRISEPVDPQNVWYGGLGFSRVLNAIWVHRIETSGPATTFLVGSDRLMPWGDGSAIYGTSMPDARQPSDIAALEGVAIVPVDSGRIPNRNSYLLRTKDGHWHRVPELDYGNLLDSRADGLVFILVARSGNYAGAAYELRRTYDGEGRSVFTTVLADIDPEPTTGRFAYLNSAALGMTIFYGQRLLQVRNGRLETVEGQDEALRNFIGRVVDLHDLPAAGAVLIEGSLGLALFDGKTVRPLFELETSTKGNAAIRTYEIASQG